MILDSDVDFGSTSLVEIEVDSSGSDLLTISGTADLAGELQIDLLNGFLPSKLDTFTISESTALLAAFDNVLNGQTITTSGGEGTFVVNYGAGSTFEENSVVLSDFTLTPIPEPGSSSSLTLIGVAWFLRRKRRA